MHDSSSPAILRQWIPSRLIRKEQQPLFEWRFAGDKIFSEPFFEETLTQLRMYPQNSSRFTPASSAAFLSGLEPAGSTQPGAIIFHISRCGSTLYTQLLGQDRRNIVLSEVPVFDEILRAPGFSDTEREQLLRSTIGMYTQQRHPEEERFFIKTDCWHIYQADVYRALFPGTPFFFLFRDPAAVLRSHAKRRGSHMIPGLIPQPVPEDAFENSDFDQYGAHVLGAYFAAGLALCKTDPLAFPVNYSEGGVAGLLRVCALAGISFDDATIERMIARGGFHSKYPGEAFRNEDPADEPGGEAFAQAKRLYDELEAMRLIFA